MRVTRAWAMLLAAAVAVSGGPSAVGAQNVRPYTLDDVEQLFEAGYDRTQVFEVVRASCISFIVDDAAEERLRALGFTQEFVGAFRSVCFDPRPDAGQDAAGVDDPRAEVGANRPAGPEIQILEPRAWAFAGERGITVAPKRSIAVHGAVRHSNGVSHVKINGARAALTIDAGGMSGAFSGFVPVTRDTREVEIAAWGVDGRVSARTFAVRPDMAANTQAGPTAGAGESMSAFRGRRWAVVIGISDYRDPAIPDLQYADADALAVYDFLRSEAAGLGGIPTRNMRLLLNEDATTRNIRSALFTFLKQSTDDDVLVIYIAGHGMPDPERLSNLYLLAHDTELADLAATGIAMDDVNDAINEAYARNKVLIADACHSAGVGAAGGRAVNLNLTNQAFLDAIRSSSGGFVAFTAAEATQLSQEGAQWGGGHGVFTYYLLEGLRGEADADDDRLVMLGELMEYTRDRVRRETRNGQIPAISLTSYDRFWPMAIVTH